MDCIVLEELCFENNNGYYQLYSWMLEKQVIKINTKLFLKYVHYKKIQAKYYQTEYLSRGAIQLTKKSNVQKKLINP